MWSNVLVCWRVFVCRCCLGFICGGGHDFKFCGFYVTMIVDVERLCFMLVGVWNDGIGGAVVCGVLLYVRFLMWEF